MATVDATGKPLDPAALFRSVSDDSRLRLLRLLKDRELNVQELVAITGLSQPRVSKHLGLLRAQGWLSQRREGTWSWYQAVPAEEIPAGPDLFAQVMRACESAPQAAADEAGLHLALQQRRQRVRDTVAGIADRWDLIRARYEHPDLRLAVLGGLVDPRLRVLDIGTGTGAMLPALGAAADMVVALDNSGPMLDRARALCRRQGLRRVRFCRADVAELPFGPRSFDACCCAMALHHVDRPDLAVAEMARVLAPGGRLMITAFRRHAQEWMRQELAHRWLGFERRELEAHLLAAGLTPTGYLVRGPGTAEPGARDPRTDGFAWPEVFLLTARKRGPDAGG